MQKLRAMVLVGSVVLLGGCFNSPQTATVTVEDGQPSMESLSEWEKIGEAMQSGKSVKCEMLNTETQQTGQYYMKGEKVRFDMYDPEDAETSGSFLTDAEFIYTWNDTKKEGVKFAVPKPGEVQPEAAQETEAPDFSEESAWKDYENKGYTVTCSVESFDEALLTPPADVTFADMSEFMQNMQSSGDASTQPSGEMSQEQLEQLMQQYKQ